MYRISTTFNQICYNNKRSNGKSKDGLCVNQAPLFESANYIADLKNKSIDLFQLFKSDDGKKYAPLFRQYLAEKNIKSLNDFKQIFRNTDNPNTSIHFIDEKQRCYILDLPAALGIDNYIYVSDFKDFEKFSILFEIINPSTRISRTGNPVKLYKYTGENPILRKFSGVSGITQVEWSKLFDYGGYKFLLGEGDLSPQYFLQSNRGVVYTQFLNLAGKINQYAHLKREEFTSLSPEDQKQIVINDILDAALNGQKTVSVISSQAYIRYTLPPGDERYKAEYANIVVGGRKANKEGLTFKEWAEVLGISEREVSNALTKFDFTNKSKEDKDKIFSNILYVNYLGPECIYTGNEQLVLSQISKAQNELKKLIDENASDDQISVYLNDYPTLDNLQRQQRINDYLSGGFKERDFAKIFNKSSANRRQIFLRSGHTQTKADYYKVISDINSNADSMQFIEQKKQELANEAIEKLAGVKIRFNMEYLLNQEFASFKQNGITFKRQQLVRYQMPGSDLIGWVLLDGIFLKDGKIILVVECQGQQHYQFVRFHKTASYENWLDLLKRDRIKLAYCHDLNIPVIYVSRYLDNQHIKILFDNLRSNINYYANEVPSHPDLDSFIYVPNQDPKDIEQEIQIYSDRIVSDHISAIKTDIYKNISEDVKFKLLKDKLIALSKLVILFEKSLYSQEEDFIRTFDYNTDLSRGYEFVKRSFEKISDNPIDFSCGINFGMIQSKNVFKIHQESEDLESELEKQKELKEQRILERNQGVPKPPRQRRYQEETLLSTPEELKDIPGLKPEDSVSYKKLIKQGIIEEEALRIVLDRIKRRNLRSQYGNQLTLRGFSGDEMSKFYDSVMLGQDAQSVMEQISSSRKRKRDFSYREELVSLGFKPTDVNIYDRRIRAGEDPEFVKSDILQKIEKKKKDIAEYAFGRDKKKRYRIKIINKKRLGVAMNQTLGKLVKIANLLDSNGLHNEADKLTRVAMKLAQNFNDEYDKYEMRTQSDYDRSQEDGGMMGGDYSALAALENDPLMKRYKMEYQKDPMSEGDEEMGNLVHGKLMEALSGTYLEDALEAGDDLYIMESWLKDEMTLPESAEEYEVGLREHRNDFGDDGYDPLDD